MTRIIAFDLGQHLAIAAAGCATVCYDLNPKSSRPHRLAEALSRITDFLDALQYHGTDGGPWVAVYERPFARGQAATRALWGYAAIIEAACAHHGVAVLDTTPGQIKQWATGRGDASKELMIARSSELGYFGLNEHEADAVLLMHMAEDQIMFDRKGTPVWKSSLKQKSPAASKRTKTKETTPPGQPKSAA